MKKPKQKGKSVVIIPNPDKKKPVNGRQKGATFEREIARELTKWTGIPCRRTPMSGGWNKTGDITPKDPADMVRWPFNLELKNNESWDMRMLFDEGPTGLLPKTIQDFWEQCFADSELVKKRPILIFTKNLHPVFVMMLMMDYKKTHLPTASARAPTLMLGSRVVLLWRDFTTVPYATVAAPYLSR